VLKPQSAQLGFKRSFFQFAAKRTLMIVNEGSESPCLRVCSGVCYLSFNGFLLYTVNPIAKALSLRSTFSSSSPLSPLFFLSLCPTLPSSLASTEPDDVAVPTSSA
jgi:hypothetical protein